MELINKIYMEIIPTLKKFGLNEKEIKVYLSLLEYGPASVRKLAQLSGVNRGTTYDILKSLMALSLVSYYHKDTKQIFVAEDPVKFLDAITEKEQSLLHVKKDMQDMMPSLKSLYKKAGGKPVVKFYEGIKTMKIILQDVLSVTEESKEKTYYIFSSSSIRPYLHQAWPTFTAERIKRGIYVNAIALGHMGTKAPLSERKVLIKEESSPTYLLIYPGKVAMISVNEHKELMGLIIEDQALFESQLQIFNYIWKTL